jgi:hypothetical protein
MIEREHPALGVKLVVNELTQGKLEKLLENLKDKTGLPLGQYYGSLVRAAIIAEWLEEPDWEVEDVADQKPAVIKWMGEQIDRLYAEATTVPPL